MTIDDTLDGLTEQGQQAEQEPQAQPDPAPVAQDAAPSGDDGAAQQGAESAAQDAGEQTAGGDEPRGPSGLEAALDKLTKDGAEAPEIVRPDGKTAGGLAGGDAPKVEGQKPEAEATAGGQKPEAGEAKKPAPAPADGLEGASDKARARFQQLAQERSQYQQQVQALRSELEGAGFDNESFATVLEIGRCVSSNDPNEKRMALKMIDRVRENLAAEIGEEVPGVDLLRDFPDLQQKVEGFELTRGAALEVAKARRIEQAQQSAIQAQQAQVLAAQQQQQAVAGAQQAVAGALYSHKDDVDFSARLAALKRFIQSGDNLQRIGGQDPATWAGTLELLYRNMGAIAAQQQAARSPSPISSRTLRRGTPELRADADPADKLLAKMEQMGL